MSVNLNRLQNLEVKALLACTLLIIAFGRWITQVWLGPLPLLDATFQLIVFLHCVGFYRKMSQTKLKMNGRYLFGFLKIYFFFLIVKIVAAILSGKYPTETILRDMTCFLVISQIPVIVNIFIKIDAGDAWNRRVSKLLALSGFIALIHASFSVFLTSSLGWSLSLPVIQLQANILSVRSDQFICAISPLLIFLISNIAHNHNRFWSVLVFGVLVLFVLTKLQSRAVLIATVASILLGIIMILNNSRIKPEEKLLSFSFLIMAAPITFELISKVPSFRRLASGLGLNNALLDGDAITSGAIGTQHARQQAWQLVMSDWRSNFIFEGYPAGFHFIQATGAIYFLSGSLDVRWPHNFFISALVRNGIVFGVLLIIAILTTIRISLLNAKSESNTTLDWQILAFQISTLVVSALGVVMESPFGYLPFVILTSISVSRYFSK